MLGLVSRRLSQLRWVGDPSTQLCFLPRSSLKLLSNTTNENENERQSLAVDYLVNSCGLPPELALKAFKRCAFKSTDRADSILALFKNYGFTQHQISIIISHNLDVLRLDPDKILKPKIELLCNMGISNSVLMKILSRCANFLTINLEKELIPTLEFFKSFIPTNEKVAVTLSRMSWCSRRIPERMMGNIEFLRNQGVPEPNISNLIFRQPRLLTWPGERFKGIIMEAKEMGLNPRTTTFIHGIRARAGMNKPVWEAKIAVFSSFGWSEDEIFSMLQKSPTICALSERRIRERLDYFMNELNWTVADLGKCPAAFQCSMENRIVPRCSVLRVLVAKGLIKVEKMVRAIQLTNDKFLDKYVLKYTDELPELLEIYQKEMGIWKLEPESEMEIGSNIMSGKQRISKL